LLFSLQAYPTQWIAKSTRLVGDITIPVLLITLGVSLSRMRVLNTVRALLLSIARTGLGFLPVYCYHGLSGLQALQGVFLSFSAQCLLRYSITCLQSNTAKSQMRLQSLL
jgi:predicted permease